MTDPEAVVVMSRDLFFAMRIRGVLRQLGFRAVLTKSEAEYVTALGASPVPVLGVVDFNQPVDWPVVMSNEDDVAIVAFGAHTDIDGFRAAKAAGVARTVSNGEFDRSFPQLIERHRRRP